jgi:hypothetical protein
LLTVTAAVSPTVVTFHPHVAYSGVLEPADGAGSLTENVKIPDRDKNTVANSDAARRSTNPRMIALDFSVFPDRDRFFFPIFELFA